MDDLDDLLDGERRDVPRTTPKQEPTRCPYCAGSGRVNQYGRRSRVCWKCKGEGVVARARNRRRARR